MYQTDDSDTSCDGSTNQTLTTSLAQAGVAPAISAAIASELQHHETPAAIVTSLLNAGLTPDSVIVGASRSSVLIGTAANELIVGGPGSNIVVAGDGADTIIGGRGQNALFGEGGDDLLVGGSHADYLSGGYGNDTLVGGGGRDTFSFEDFWGRDVVVDFDPKRDVIQLPAVYYSSFQQVLHDAKDDGHGNLVITTPDHAGNIDTITLMGVSASSLHASNFVFI